MEYYPTIKGNEVLVHATTWMNFEDIAEFKKPDKKKFYYFIYLKYPD